MRDLILYSMLSSKMNERLADGVKAYVWPYYNEYTDARELEPRAIHTLRMLTDDFDLDVVDLVREAEREMNEAGGIRSDTTGKTHKVRTFNDATD